MAKGNVGIKTRKTLDLAEFFPEAFKISFFELKKFTQTKLKWGVKSHN